MLLGRTQQLIRVANEACYDLPFIFATDHVAAFAAYRGRPSSDELVFRSADCMSENMCPSLRIPRVFLSWPDTRL